MTKVHDEPAMHFFEEDWSKTIMNLDRVDFTGKSPGLLQEIIIKDLQIF